VVLLAPGGVQSADGAEDFVYRLLMDPYRFPSRWLPVWLRNVGARVLARRQARDLSEALHAVGGISPEARIVGEQSRALQAALARRAGGALSARVYVASRYADPQAEATLERVLSDGCDRVVLVPMTPVRLTAVTDACLAWWQAVCTEREVAPETVVVPAAAQAEPFVEALSERVGEALHRFHKAIRSNVHLVFAAHPAAKADAPDHLPESSPLGELARQMLSARHETRPVHWSYATSWGVSRSVTPTPREALEDASAQGASGILVVPLGYSSDTVETAYGLDIEMRALAQEMGFGPFEVTAGINCHALYVDALASSVLEAVGWQAAPVALAS
jgi:ferrochelatase